MKVGDGAKHRLVEKIMPNHLFQKRPDDPGHQYSRLGKGHALW